MKFAATLAAARTPDEIGQAVQRMRNLAMIYRAPLILWSRVARLIFAAEPAGRA